MEKEPPQRLVSTWEAITKDDEGEAHIHTLHKYEVVPDEVGEEQFINQAAPTQITPGELFRPRRRDRLAVVLPDAQIPFHDEKALEMAHAAVRELSPDRVVLLGDMVDLPGQSSFDTHPNHTGIVQDQLDQTHNMLAQIRANAPDAQIDYIPGNHEKRLQRQVMQKNAELLGIKRANAEESLGVLTLEFLLRLGELEVNMAAEYPNGEVWLNDETVAVHGTTSSASSSTSARYLSRAPHLNTIHGHSHRAEIQWKTSRTRGGAMDRWAMSPGTLADRGGSVPSHGSSMDDMGRHNDRTENWQHAVGLVEYNNQMSNPELAMIRNGILKLRGESYGVEEQQLF